MTTPLFQEAEEHSLPVREDEWVDENTADSVEAPYGYTVDRETGEQRPKKRPGRPRKEGALPSGVTPSLDDLKARSAPRVEDVAPVPAKRGRRRGSDSEPEPLPPFRAGPIAKGMNSLYRRAGKFLKFMEPDIGRAVIACTYAEDEDDVTIGEAWENLARTNPRIRAFLMKLLQGGAWSGLFMAHMPILMAVLMKESVRNRLPIDRLVNAFLTDDDPRTGESGPSDFASAMGGINPEDMAQMMNFAQTMMGNHLADLPRSQNTARETIVVEGE